MSTVVLINDIIPYLCIYVATPTGIGQSPGLLKGKLPIIYRSPVRSHIPIVLFQAVGKTVMPVAVAHKIEVVSVRGMLGCFQGTLPRIANRARRQTGMRVRVVGRWKTHVGVVQRAAVRALQEFGVNHARIGLQGDVF